MVYIVPDKCQLSDQVVASTFNQLLTIFEKKGSTLIKVKPVSIHLHKILDSVSPEIKIYPLISLLSSLFAKCLA